jgi:hypothetical protein
VNSLSHGSCSLGGRKRCCADVATPTHPFPLEGTLLIIMCAEHWHAVCRLWMWGRAHPTPVEPPSIGSKLSSNNLCTKLTNMTHKMFFQFRRW